MSIKNRHRLNRRNYRNIMQQKHNMQQKTESKIVALRETPKEGTDRERIIYQREEGKYQREAVGYHKEAIVYQSELDYLARCILDYPDIETGGQLFGFYTAKGTPVVCYAIGPGRLANHQVTFFNQDIDYLQTVGDRLVREYGLQHIGEWHSHHQLRLDHPSGHDAQTMHHSINSLHLGQFLLCIGTTDGLRATVNAFTFCENALSHYPTHWNIKAEPSPYRAVIDEKMKDMLLHPTTAEPRLKDMKISKLTIAQTADANYLLRAYNN